MTQKVAIIGAGIAGLAAAKRLSHDFDITVFEKSRGTGGRMSTRYDGAFEFDHGAQYFTAKSPHFQALVDDLERRGIVKPWNARFVEIDDRGIVTRHGLSDHYPHYVGVPRMNAVGKFMAEGLDVKLNALVGSIQKSLKGWVLITEDDRSLGHFDWVIVAVPYPQAVNLLSKVSPILDRASHVKMQGCFALMLGLDRPVSFDWDAASIRRSPVGWISVNNTKPGRSPEPSLVVLSDNGWAESFLEHDPEWVKRQLVEAASDLTHMSLEAQTLSLLHRWRYANCTPRDGADLLVDFEETIAVCGDWSVEGRVEGAYLSGVAIGDAIKDFPKR